MRKLTAIILLIIVMFSSTAFAERGRFGLGVMIGEPTGISGKLWLSRTMAFDGGAAWSFGKHDRLHLHGDYLFHTFSLTPVEIGELPIYYGIGGRIQFREYDLDDRVGVRFPFGIEYIFEDAPFDIFFEIVPILDIAPETEIDFNAAIGFRYFFGGRSRK